MDRTPRRWGEARSARELVRSNWRLQSKRSDEEQWTYHEPPLREDLLTLKELIERKYRRRRATIDELRAVEKLVQQSD